MSPSDSAQNRPALVLTPVGRDATVICSMLREVGIEAHEQASLSQLVGKLDSAGAAIIAEEALVHEERSALARWIVNQPPWSDFPFVLLTMRTAHNGLALPELLELLGNVTVLERPLAATSLKSAVRAAIRGRRRQRQAERYLDELKDLTDTLERRVDQRTKELSEANSRLVTEMAERERTELALRHAQKLEAVGQLTGGIAHDFNNLLTAIMGNLELLEARLNDAGMQRFLRNAMHGARRGERLVKQLLAFSRKQQLTPESVDINELVSTAGELLARTLGEGIRVDVVTAKGLGPALVDATQLELVLLNLAFNARDAMPEGGILTIETAAVDGVLDHLSPDLQAGHYVSVAVRDTGHGMAPDVLARAFDPFFTTKPLGKGTGLGLSQVHGFAHQSGGTVKIESRVGYGTEVRLFLPRSLVPVASRGSEYGEPANSSDRQKVLVVDDDANVRETTRGMLEDLGYQVFVAESAAAALSLVSTEAVDITLIDLAMPDISGLQLGLQLRQHKPELAILFCSGYPDLVAANSNEMDGDLFLTKPFSLRELSSKIDLLLQGKRLAPLRTAAND